MTLTPITEKDFDVVLDLRYATDNNFVGEQIYEKPLCFLHPEAADKLILSIKRARHLGYRFKIYDGFRPVQAQYKLWEKCPDDRFVTPPEKGSPHSRGVAIDLTLIDDNGQALDMGTGFDHMHEDSFHSALLSPEVSRNRHMLLGIMMSSGWDLYMNEWWHYQLFDAREKYPLVKDCHGIMKR